jgi:hypothetical protein
VIRLITEVLGLILGQLDVGMNTMGRKVWLIAIGAAVGIGAVFLMFIGIAFFAFALYHNLVVSIGPAFSAFIVGGFFVLIALILLIISKKLIRRR